MGYWNFFIVKGSNGEDEIHLSDSTEDLIVISGGGDDLIFTGSGDDKIIAGSGDDTVNSGAGNDLIIGGSGNDTLRGSTGHDFIVSGSGNDIAWGGSGSDVLIMGGGDDTAVWEYDETVSSTLDYYDGGGSSWNTGNDTLQLTFTDIQLESLNLTEQQIQDFFDSHIGNSIDFRNLHSSLTLVADQFEKIRAIS